MINGEEDEMKVHVNETDFSIMGTTDLERAFFNSFFYKLINKDGLCDKGNFEVFTCREENEGSIGFTIRRCNP